MSIHIYRRKKHKGLCERLGADGKKIDQGHMKEALEFQWHEFIPKAI